MSVNFRKVPDDMKKAFLFTVHDLFPNDVDLTAALRRGADEIKGLPVFTIPFDNLLSNGQMNAVRPAGWRLFFRSPPIAIAADATVPFGGPPRITGISQGQPLARVIDAVLAVLQSPGLQGHEEYEPRLLRLSSAYVEACWLHSNTGLPDRIVPIVTGIRSLEERKPYGLDDFFGEIMKAASRIKETGGN